MKTRAVGVVLGAALGAAPGLSAAQDYRFPTSSDDYAHFYPTAYKDHGGTDWNCGDIYYSGHGGSDFGVGGFAGMAEGRDIVAAADGVVGYSVDGFADDCTTGDCPGGGGFGNYVQLDHGDGKTTWYGHMRTWSVLVAAGDPVTCGQKIGEVGSSGRSTGPHLHFEVRIAGASSDPFDGPCSAPPTYWVDQGPHGGLPGLTCDGSAACTPVAALTCGGTWSGRNDGAGSTGGVGGWGCVDYAYSGREITFSFVAPADGPVSFALGGLSADLDLFVGEGTGCLQGDCLGAGSSPSTADEAVSIDAVAGAEYRIIVDGWDGAASDFVLDVACANPGDDDTGDDDAADDDTGDDDAADDDAGDDDAGDDDAGDDDAGDDDAGDDDSAGQLTDDDDGPARPDGASGAGRGCRASIGGAWLLPLVLGRRRGRRAPSPAT